MKINIRDAILGMNTEKLKKIASKIRKILLWTVGSILGLFFLVVISLQIPVVQNYVKEKAVSYLQDKIKTKVSIGTIEIGLPKKIILKEVYFEDQSKDTLLYGKKVAVDISLFKLFHNTLQINSVHLVGITGKVTKNNAGKFNFDYIIDAFASKEPPEKDEKPMVIALSDVILDDISIVFDDVVSKNDFAIKLNHFDANIENFDVENLVFDVPKINIDGFKLSLNQGIAKATANTTNAIKKEVEDKYFQFTTEQVALSNIEIAYKQENSKLTTKLKFKALQVDFETLDLVNQIIKIKKFSLDEADGKLVLGKIEQQNIKNNQEPSSKSKPWELAVKKINISKINFSFDENNATKIASGIDYKHFELKNFNLTAKEIKYNPILSSGLITSASLSEKSGLKIENFKTKFYYSTSVAYLKNLYIKTPKTEIKDQIVVNYKDITTIATDLKQLAIKAVINKSSIAVSDILIFAPQLANQNVFSANKNAVLKIDGIVYGKIDNLNIQKFEFSGIGETFASISGKIKGLPDVEKSFYDLTIKSIKTTANDIVSFVPSGTIPATIQLPEQLVTKGTFKGKIANFDVNLLVNSSMGNAKIIANFDQTKKDKEKYTAEAWLDEFDMGAFLKNKTLGKLSVKAAVKGIGLNPKTANATINSTISKAEFNQYGYHDIAINGVIKNGLYDATITSTDENLKFDLVSTGGFKDKYPTLKLDLNVDIADLDKLNLHAGYLKLKGNVAADFDQLDIDHLNGKLNITNTLVALETEQFPLDSISLTATSTAEKNSISIRSQFVAAELTGNYKLSTLQDAVMQSISKYYQISAAKSTKTEAQNLAFSVQIKDEPLLQKLVPEIKNLFAIRLEGKYNSVNDSIHIDAAIPKLNYNDVIITNAILKVTKEENALVYNFVIDDLKNASFHLPFSKLSGKIAKNTVDYDLQLKDIENVDRYLLSGSLSTSNGNSAVKFKKDNLKLNYQTWNIDDNNVIKITEKGILINDFILKNGTNTFTLNSEENTPNAPILATFTDFDLKALTSIVESNFEIGGTINGSSKISNLTTKPAFVADLTIENFSIKKDTVGNVKLNIASKTANLYGAKVEISGNDNAVFLIGDYQLDNGNFDLKVDIDKFQMKSLQAFALGNISKSTGFLNGKLAITGNANEPIIAGFVKFNDVGFELKTLNTKLKLLNDKIDFDDQKMIFTQFKLQDENDNNLRLDGTIDLKNVADLGLNLTLVAQNFNPINSTEKDNDLFYGALFLDSNIDIKGSANKPIVNGTVKINKDTKFYVVLPQTDPSLVSREGIVEFIDQDQPILYDDSKKADQFNQSQITGIEASLIIEVDKDAEISIVIDKANGDYLKLKGEAELVGGIDASGKTSLTGKYEFTGGQYEMNFNLIKRKFDIKPGSYILWKGEPTAADVNITAIYKADVAPIDLVSDQLGSVSAETRNTFKQKIPFETKLIMTGELMQPKISFDIVLPDGNNSVSAEVINTTKAKLAQIRRQEEVLNKQVFALLLLNRFIGENPFESETGGISAATLARQSASKILSQQLNNLAGDLISGVELNFDLQSTEDYTSGTKENKTDLNVQLSKKLLNDRLKVTVGSNIGLEGTTRDNEQASTIAGDIAADYLLTEDGRYKVRAYRKNNYQVALQGQVVETGVAFVITIDYNKFKELFEIAKKKRAKKSTKKTPTDEKL
jgi:hypothetical protein